MRSQAPRRQLIEGPRVFELTGTFRRRQSQGSPGCSAGTGACPREPVCYGRSGGRQGPPQQRSLGSDREKPQSAQGHPTTCWLLGPAMCCLAGCSLWTQDWSPLDGLTQPSAGPYAGSISRGLDGRAKLTAPPSWTRTPVWSGGSGNRLELCQPGIPADKPVTVWVGCWAAVLAPPKSPVLRGSQEVGNLCYHTVPQRQSKARILSRSTEGPLPPGDSPNISLLQKVWPVAWVGFAFPDSWGGEEDLGGAPPREPTGLAATFPLFKGGVLGLCGSKCPLKPSCARRAPEHLL